MISFAEFLLMLNVNENIIHVLENHYHKASSHSGAGVRYSHLIPHSVLYCGLSISPYFFFSSVVPGRYFPFSPKVNFTEDDFRRFHFRRNEFFTENHLK